MAGVDQFKQVLQAEQTALGTDDNNTIIIQFDNNNESQYEAENKISQIPNTVEDLQQALKKEWERIKTLIALLRTATATTEEAKNEIILNLSHSYFNLWVLLKSLIARNSAALIPEGLNGLLEKLQEQMFNMREPINLNANPVEKFLMTQAEFTQKRNENDNIFAAEKVIAAQTELNGIINNQLAVKALLEGEEYATLDQEDHTYDVLDHSNEQITLDNLETYHNPIYQEIRPDTPQEHVNPLYEEIIVPLIDDDEQTAYNRLLEALVKYKNDSSAQNLPQAIQALNLVALQNSTNPFIKRIYNGVENFSSISADDGSRWVRTITHLLDVVNCNFYLAQQSDILQEYNTLNQNQKNTFFTDPASSTESMQAILRKYIKINNQPWILTYQNFIKKLDTYNSTNTEGADQEKLLKLKELKELKELASGLAIKLQPLELENQPYIKEFLEALKSLSTVSDFRRTSHDFERFTFCFNLSQDEVACKYYELNRSLNDLKADKFKKWRKLWEDYSQFKNASFRLLGTKTELITLLFGDVAIAPNASVETIENLFKQVKEAKNKQEELENLLQAQRRNLPNLLSKKTPKYIQQLSKFTFPKELTVLESFKNTKYATDIEQNPPSQYKQITLAIDSKLRFLEACHRNEKFNDLYLLTKTWQELQSLYQNLIDSHTEETATDNSKKIHEFNNELAYCKLCIKKLKENPLPDIKTAIARSKRASDALKEEWNVYVLRVSFTVPKSLTRVNFDFDVYERVLLELQQIHNNKIVDYALENCRQIRNSSGVFLSDDLVQNFKLFHPLIATTPSPLMILANLSKLNDALQKPHLLSPEALEKLKNDIEFEYQRFKILFKNHPYETNNVARKALYHGLDTLSKKKEHIIHDNQIDQNLLNNILEKYNDLLTDRLAQNFPSESTKTLPTAILKVKGQFQEFLKDDENTKLYQTFTKNKPKYQKKSDEQQKLDDQKTIKEFVKTVEVLGLQTPSNTNTNPNTNTNTTDSNLYTTVLTKLHQDARLETTKKPSFLQRVVKRLSFSRKKLREPEADSASLLAEIDAPETPAELLSDPETKNLIIEIPFETRQKLSARLQGFNTRAKIQNLGQQDKENLLKELETELKSCNKLLKKYPEALYVQKHHDLLRKLRDDVQGKIGKFTSEEKQRNSSHYDTITKPNSINHTNLKTLDEDRQQELKRYDVEFKEDGCKAISNYLKDVAEKNTKHVNTLRGAFRKMHQSGQREIPIHTLNRDHLAGIKALYEEECHALIIEAMQYLDQPNKYSPQQGADLLLDLAYRIDHFKHHTQFTYGGRLEGYIFNYLIEFQSKVLGYLDNIQRTNLAFFKTIEIPNLSLAEHQNTLEYATLCDLVKLKLLAFNNSTVDDIKNLEDTIGKAKLLLTLTETKDNVVPLSQEVTNQFLGVINNAQGKLNELKKLARTTIPNTEQFTNNRTVMNTLRNLHPNETTQTISESLQRRNSSSSHTIHQ